MDALLVLNVATAMYRVACSAVVPLLVGPTHAAGGDVASEVVDFNVDILTVNVDHRSRREGWLLVAPPRFGRCRVVVASLLEPSARFW